MDFLPILDSYVVTLLKCIASIKDCITRTALPFWYQSNSITGILRRLLII
jgi:hypothetical protein